MNITILRLTNPGVNLSKECIVVVVVVVVVVSGKFIIWGYNALPV